MIYAKKKIQSPGNTAEQRGKIIANVEELQQRNLIRLEGNEVFLYPQLWKSKAVALNWMECLHWYFRLKKQFKEKDELLFKNYETAALIGSYRNKKPKVLIF